MDMMRFLWCWAAHTGRISPSPISQQIYGKVERCQLAGSRKALRALGIRDAASFERKRHRLQVAAELVPYAIRVRMIGGLTPSPWSLTAGFVTWPLVSIHVCEHRQILARLGSAALKLACGRNDAAIAAAWSASGRYDGYSRASKTLAFISALADKALASSETAPPPRKRRRCKSNANAAATDVAQEQAELVMCSTVGGSTPA